MVPTNVCNSSRRRSSGSNFRYTCSIVVVVMVVFVVSSYLSYSSRRSSRRSSRSSRRSSISSSLICRHSFSNSRLGFLFYC